MNDFKVIFLDIDGVLNKSSFGEDTYYDKFADSDLALDQDLIANLKTLVESDDSIRIVWSSDWGVYDKEYWNRWKNPIKHIESFDWMKGKVLGITPRKLSSEHFHEIKWWLDHHPDINDYVILEDSYFPDEWFGLEHHLVRCDSAKGFDNDCLEKALMILND